MSPSPTVRGGLIRRALAATTVTAVAAATLIGVAAPAAYAADPVVDLVDGTATPETESLFAYLQDPGGVLFGHQHATDYGNTFTTRDGVSADVLAATGDYPAVFGFDTLIIEGGERPGVFGGDRTQNALLLADAISEADEKGAISTLSMHMENVVTGGNFNDVGGDTLRAVLPGGAKHAELTAYLDLVAFAAQNAVDADGDLIPIIFRPWHENAGSWFWWGAAFGTPGEYAELFRFTVEYLRDVKGVHNFLYAFSPASGFGASEEQYLRTYPGDDFVDVLGYDWYDAAASEVSVDALVADLAMMANVAEERGKIPALTEFGITGGVKADGQNPNLTWFTDVLDAIKADPAASQIAYMLTWANFGEGINPYTPTSGEMLADFQAYHDDPATLFASEIGDPYALATAPVAQQPTAHLVSPADGARVAVSPTTVRASINGYDADRVFITVEGLGDVELSAPAEGQLWWSAEWAPDASVLDNSTRAFTLHVIVDGEEVVTSTTQAVVGPRPVLPAGVVDDFEGYGDNVALRSEYVQIQANTIELESSAVGAGSQAMRLSYSFASQSYTGVGKQTGGDWSAFGAFEAWVDPDASGNKLVLQIVADGVAFEAYPSLASDEPYLASIPFADWRPAPWDTANQDRRLDAATLAKVAQFNVYVNAVDGGAVSGSVVVDELRAVPGPPPQSVYDDVPLDHPDYAAIAWLHGVYDLAGKNGKFQASRPVKVDDVRAVLDAYDAESAAYPLASAKRLEVARILWQMFGSPEPETLVSTFRDVAEADRAAVSWVIESGILDAAAPTRFGSVLPVTRVELASWLYAFDQLPDPIVPETLFTFDDGAQGWALASWDTGGTVSAADGRLVVDPGASGNWISWSGSLDLTDRTALVVEVPETTGIDVKAALQLGSSWAWCETPQTGYVTGPRTGDDALIVDLTGLTPECAALLGDVRGLNLYINNGHHEIDSISVR